MLRRSSLVECVSVLQKSVNNVSNFFLFVNVYSHVCQKILSTHFISQRARWCSHINMIFWLDECGFEQLWVSFIKGQGSVFECLKLFGRNLNFRNDNHENSQERKHIPRELSFFSYVRLVRETKYKNNCNLTISYLKKKT